MNTFLEAVMNGWWQGIVLTLLVWLALRDLPRISAATRLAIWQVTLLVVLLLPALQRIPLTSLQRATTTTLEAEHTAPITAPNTALAPAEAAPHAEAAPDLPRPRPVIDLSETNWPGFLL